MSTRDEIKRKAIRKCLWGGLSIFAIFLLIIAVFFLIANETGSLKKTEAEKTAISALKMRLGNPVSLKILDVSKPDSVFVNRICPEYEAMELSEKFLAYSLNIMQDSQAGLGNSESKAYRCKMDRYTDSSAALNNINAMLEKPEGAHCGWRIKVRYQSVDESDTPYISEAWFIFDKQKRHILNSFEISLL